MEVRIKIRLYENEMGEKHERTYEAYTEYC
jgi:hypothetical protein